MKTKNRLILVFATLIFISCNQTGSIQIQNKISNVEIIDIQWGKNYIESDLLPGETSSKMTISDYDESLPASHKVTFKMTANNKSIYLETEKNYVLNANDNLLIILTDSTKVNNPNE